MVVSLPRNWYNNMIQLTPLKPACCSKLFWRINICWSSPPVMLGLVQDSFRKKINVASQIHMEINYGSFTCLIKKWTCYRNLMFHINVSRFLTSPFPKGVLFGGTPWQIVGPQGGNFRPPSCHVVIWNPISKWPETKFTEARWWFQIFFIFTPIWGRFPIWLIFLARYFSDGLKPPTRKLLNDGDVFFFYLYTRWESTDLYSWKVGPAGSRCGIRWREEVSWIRVTGATQYGGTDCWWGFY